MSVSIDTKGLFEKIFDNFKKITPALLSISLLTGLLLFLPETVLAKMSLNDLPVIWKKIIGIVFLLSTVLIFTICAVYGLRNIHKKYNIKKQKKKRKKSIATLSPQQKQIIINLLHSKDKSIKLNKNSGDTVFLENNMFLYAPQQAFTLDWDDEIILTYVPRPWLLELYNEEPDLFC